MKLELRVVLFLSVSAVDPICNSSTRSWVSGNCRLCCCGGNKEIMIIISTEGICLFDLTLSNSFLPLGLFPLLFTFHLYLHSCTSYPFTGSFFISLTPPPCKAYKSHGDRLAPLGMSQPEAWSKDSSPDMASLCSKTTSRGDIYMKGMDPSHGRGEERVALTEAVQGQ